MKENMSNNDLKDVSDSSNALMLKYESELESSPRFTHKQYKYSSKEKRPNSLKDPNQRDRQGCLSLFWKQTKLMMWKNYLVFTRSLKPTVFQLITPVLICIILLSLQGLMNFYSENVKNLNPKVVDLENLEKCVYPEDCTTIGYGLIVT
jgi:hypothetical protein